MWLVPPGLGAEGGWSCWPAAGMCCAAQWHRSPLAAAGYHNLCLLLQPEAAEQSIVARAALLQLAHIWCRTQGLGLHHCHVGCRPSWVGKQPSECQSGVERDVGTGRWNAVGKTLTLDPYACIDVAHREKTAPLGFCESIFSDKRCNLSLPTCLCSAHAGHLLLSDRGAARLRCPWTAPKSSQPTQTKAVQWSAAFYRQGARDGRTLKEGLSLCNCSFEATGSLTQGYICLGLGDSDI